MCGYANEHQWLLAKLFLAEVLEVDDLTVLDSESCRFFIKHIGKLFRRACLTTEIDTEGWQIARSCQ